MSSADHAQNSTEQALAVAHVPGRPYPKGVSGNPAGRPKGHKAVLRGLIGEHGQKGYELIWKIANGELSFQKLVRDPGPAEDAASAATLIPLVTVVPTIRERLDAAEFLIEQLNGKATATLDVNTTIETSHKFDLSRLDDKRLALLEQTLAVASTGDVVDAEFTTDAPGLLPDGWTDGEGFPALPSGVVECASVFPVDCETATASEFPPKESIE
jgi:hypothetical protein